MPNIRLLRSTLVAGLFGVSALLGGCVAPPPVAVAPGSIVLGQRCAAGFYQCTLPQPGPMGSPCACPGLGAPSFGTIN